MRVLTAARSEAGGHVRLESSVSMETLMENAGAEVAAAVTEKMDVTGKRWSFCTANGNGGDGAAAAAAVTEGKGDGRLVGRTGLPTVQSRRINKMGRGIRGSSRIAARRRAAR